MARVNYGRGKQFVSPKVAAEMLGLGCRGTAINWMDKGILKGYRQENGLVMISVASIEAVLARRQQQEAAALAGGGDMPTEIPI